MAGAVKTLKFATRQADIPACVVISLKFAEGDLRAEYISGSEIQTSDGAWAYAFLINELDLPGGLVLSDVQNCNIVDPYWECPAAEPVPEDECPARQIVCFQSVDEVVSLGDDDFITVLRFDETCDQWCLRRVSKNIFEQEQITVLDALDYEVFLPGEELTTGMTSYVTHIPRDYNPEDGARMSVAQIGSGTLSVRFNLNGTPLFDSPITITGIDTITLSNSAFDAAWQTALLPGGSRLTVEIVSATYIPYGTNWQGLHLALLGRSV